MNPWIFGYELPNRVWEKKVFKLSWNFFFENMPAFWPVEVEKVVGHTLF